MEKRYFEGYGVDKEGNIYNKDGSLKKIHYNQKGYLTVNLFYGGRNHCHTAQRVIALAWFGEPPHPTWEVNHKNSVRDDNRIENLEWVSKRDNRLHSYREGNRDVSGTKNANCKNTLEQVEAVCYMLEKYWPEKSYKEIATICVASAGLPTRINNGIHWREISKDYKLKYNSGDRNE